MRPPVVVVGAGAVGCLVAARLSTRGEVHVVARPRSGAAIAAAGGIRVEGRAPGIYPVRVHTRFVLPPGALVVVAVKAYDLEPLLRRLAPRLHPSHRVVLLQNGLGVATRARALLGRPAIRAVTSLAATRLGPGRVRSVATGPTCFALGSGLEAVWTAAGMPATAVADLRPHVWRKATVNAVINPLGALLGVENGRLLALRHTPRHIVAEVLRVALAWGQPMQFAPSLAHVRASMRRTARNTCSMLQDLQAGRPTEIEWLNGAIVRLGEARGVPAPCNGALAELVRARSAGLAPAPRRRAPSWRA